MKNDPRTTRLKILRGNVTSKYVTGQTSCHKYIISVGKLAQTFVFAEKVVEHP